MGFVSLALFSLIFHITLNDAEIIGKFVFHGDNEHNDQNSLLSVLHKPDSVRFAPNPGALPSNELSSVLALSLGLSIPKDINWAGLQVSNPFNLPRAVMMLSIDSLPKGHKLKLAPTDSFAIDQVDGVSSISDMYYLSQKYSLSTHIGAIFEGKSKIVSISADEKVAGSGHTNTPMSEASVWSDLTNSWKHVTGNGEVTDSLSKKQVLKRVPDVLISGFVYNEEEKTVSVNVKDLEVTFNLDDKVDFKLFSELVYMMWQYEEMAIKKSVLRDGAPDLYLLSISALKGLEKKYGSDSKKVQAAVLLIEKFVGKITKKFEKLYDGNILIVGLTVPSEADYFDKHEKEIRPALKVLQDNNVMLVNFDNSVPELHTMDVLEADAQEKLCKAIQGSIGHSSKSLKFKCAQDLPIHRVSRRSLLSAAESLTAEEMTDKNLVSHYDDMFPVIFNIWFWLLVLLILTVYAVSIAMWDMDPGRDSIIYRLTQQKIKSD